jgi:hypothetical protein
MLGKLRERRRGRTTDSSTDDPDQASSKSTRPPQFDTFRRRPQSRPTSAPSSATSTAATRASSTAAAGEGAAARTATATRTAGAVAETAELVAAPEVVIGAAVAHSARKAVHKHHENRQKREADQRDNTPARSTAVPERQRATRPTGSADVGHDTLAPRPAGSPRRQREQPAGVGGEQRSARADSDQQAQPAGQGPPLGFDAVPPTTRPSNGRGDQ